MQNNDLVYYRARAIDEDAAARRATCDAAVRRHRELAQLYRGRCRQLSTLADFRAMAWQPGPASTDLRIGVPTLAAESIAA